MKVTINPVTGELSFEVDTVAQAIALAREVGVTGSPEPEATTAAEPAAPEATAAEPAAPPTVCTETATAELTGPQYAAWEYLVANENVVHGVTLAALARHLRITPGAAGQRMLVLVKLGFAERVTTGRYKALCGPGVSE